MLIDILNDLLYTVFKPNFECFRKVRYFAKEFSHNLAELHKFEFCDVVWLRVVKAGFPPGRSIEGRGAKPTADGTVSARK